MQYVIHGWWFWLSKRGDCVLVTDLGKVPSISTVWVWLYSDLTVVLCLLHYNESSSLFDCLKGKLYELFFLLAFVLGSLFWGYCCCFCVCVFVVLFVWRGVEGGGGVQDQYLCVSEWECQWHPPCKAVLETHTFLLCCTHYRMPCFPITSLWLKYVLQMAPRD